MTNPSERRVMSIDEVTRVLGVSRALVGKAVKEGKLPAFQLGDRWLVSRAGLERLIAGDQEPTSTTDDAE